MNTNEYNEFDLSNYKLDRNVKIGKETYFAKIKTSEAKLQIITHLSHLVPVMYFEVCYVYELTNIKNENERKEAIICVGEFSDLLEYNADFIKQIEEMDSDTFTEFFNAHLISIIDLK